MCCGQRVGHNSVVIHSDGNNRCAEAGGDALDQGIGESLDRHSSADGYERGKSCGNGLPARTREDQCIAARLPIATVEKLRKGFASVIEVSVRHRPDGSASDIGPLQAAQRARDEAGLLRYRGEVELEVNAAYVRLADRRRLQ